MIDLYTLDKASLEALLAVWGEPRFRADQIWSWLYERRLPILMVHVFFLLDLTLE